MFWTVHLEGGVRRVNHAAVCINDNIYSFGGYCCGEDYKSLGPMDIHLLNTNNLRWSIIPTKLVDDGIPLKYPYVPFQRYGHTAVAYEHFVYIWGGRNDETACNILFCFNVKTLKWSKPEVFGNLPGARDGHSAIIVENNMYIFGGFEDDIDQFTRDVYCLNLNTMTWKYIQTFGNLPSYRDFHSATAINNKMYIFGGRGDRHSPYHSQEEIYTDEIAYLDLKTRQWHHCRATGKIPLGRRSHSAFVYNNMIYIFGGFNGILEQHFNDLYCFDTIKNNWSLVKPRGTPPKARRRQVCLVIGKKLYLFGGTSPENESHNTNIPPILIDYNDTHVLDFDPTLKTLAIMKVLEKNIEQLWLPHQIRWEIRTMTIPNRISRPLNSTG